MGLPTGLNRKPSSDLEYFNRKVEGSARPFVKGKRTHSLWEGLRKRGEKEGEEEEEVAMNEMGEGEQDCERNTRDVGLGHIFVHRESQEGI